MRKNGYENVENLLYVSKDHLEKIEVIQVQVDNVLEVKEDNTLEQNTLVNFL